MCSSAFQYTNRKWMDRQLIVHEVIIPFNSANKNEYTHTHTHTPAPLLGAPVQLYGNTNCQSANHMAATQCIQASR